MSLLTPAMLDEDTVGGSLVLQAIDYVQAHCKTAIARSYPHFSYGSDSTIQKWAIIDSDTEIVLSEVNELFDDWWDAWLSAYTILKEFQDKAQQDKLYDSLVYHAIRAVFSIHPKTLIRASETTEVYWYCVEYGDDGIATFISEPADNMHDAWLSAYCLLFSQQSDERQQIEDLKNSKYASTQDHRTRL